MIPVEPGLGRLPAAPRPPDHAAVDVAESLLLQLYRLARVTPAREFAALAREMIRAGTAMCRAPNQPPAGLAPERHAIPVRNVIQSVYAMLQIRNKAELVQALRGQPPRPARRRQQRRLTAGDLLRNHAQHH